MSKLMIKGQQASGTYGNASDIKINEISGMTASNAQEALVALNTSLTTLDVTSQITQNTTHSFFNAIKIGKLLIINGTINSTVANSTLVFTLPTTLKPLYNSTNNYIGVSAGINSNAGIGAIRIRATGEAYMVNVAGSSMTTPSYSILVPLQ